MTGEPGIGKTRLTAEIRARPTPTATSSCTAGGTTRSCARTKPSGRRSVGTCSVPPTCSSGPMSVPTPRFWARSSPRCSTGWGWSRARRASNPKASGTGSSKPSTAGSGAWPGGDSSSSSSTTSTGQIRRPCACSSTCCGRRPPCPLLILATYRQTDTAVTEWLAQALVGMRRTVEVERIPLAGLSAAEAQELLEAAVGRTLSERESHGAVTLRDHTRGNPFFLQEVVRDLDEAGGALEAWAAAAPDALPVPERLRDVVHWRLRELSPACMKLLGTASAMGEEFDTATVGAAIGCDDDEMLRLVDEARLAGVIFESYDRPDGHRFAPRGGPPGALRRLGRGPARAVASPAGDDPAEPLRARSPAPRRGARPPLLPGGRCRGGRGGPSVPARWQRTPTCATWRTRRPSSISPGRSRSSPGTSRHRTFCAACSSSTSPRRASGRGACPTPTTASSTRSTLAGACHRTDLLADAALGFGGVLPAGAEPDAQARALLETALAKLGPRRQQRLGRWPSAVSRSGAITSFHSPSVVSSPTMPSTWHADWDSRRRWRPCSPTGIGR